MLIALNHAVLMGDYSSVLISWHWCKWGYNCAVLIGEGRSQFIGQKTKPGLPFSGWLRWLTQAGHVWETKSSHWGFPQYAQYVRSPCKQTATRFILFIKCGPCLTMGSLSHQIHSFTGFTSSESLFSESTEERVCQYVCLHHWSQCQEERQLRQQIISIPPSPNSLAKKSPFVGTSAQLEMVGTLFPSCYVLGKTFQPCSLRNSL